MFPNIIISSYSGKIIEISDDNIKVISDKFKIPMGLSIGNDFIVAERSSGIFKLDGTPLYPFPNSVMHEIVNTSEGLWSTSTHEEALKLNGEIVWKPLKGTYHLNGICASNEIIALTAFSACGKVSPTTGVIIDYNTKEVICSGLNRPHSPRLYDGKMWVLNSGDGQFGYVENGKFKMITQLNGFTRGLAFFDNYAFIGLSQAKDRIGISASLSASGVVVVNIDDGKILKIIHIDGVIHIFDVQVCIKHM